MMATMEKLNFVALDFEYATIAGQGKYITQVGLVRVEGGVIVETYSSYVKPLCSKNEFWRAKKLEGISYEMLKDKPTFVELWDSLFGMLNGNLIVAHNARSADLAALTDELERNNISRTSNLWPTFDCLCTYELEDCGFETLCKRYDVVNKQPHDACCDAEATAQVVIAMRKAGVISSMSDIEKIHYDSCYVFSSNKKSHSKSRERLNRDEREKELQEPQCNQRVWNILNPLESTHPIIRLSHLEHNPFVGKRVCVTGDLIRLWIWREGPFSCKIPYPYNLYKSTVVEFLEKLQAEVQGNVRKDTDLLLVLAYRNYEDDHESTKHAKAKEYKNKGQEIQIMLLEEFMKLIDFV